MFPCSSELLSAAAAGNKNNPTMALSRFILLSLFHLSFSSIFLALPFALANTDPSDVQALGVLFNALNSPSVLTGWKVGEGDPCGESWKGITCDGSAVVSIDLSGLGLNGTLGYLLSDLMSLRKLDLSNNKIHDTVPYQLPPNLTSLNFAGNNLSGNLPYSISAMTSLNYLNVSNNALSTPIGDVFASLSDLGTLDLSFNNFSGDLPASFASLSNLSSLFLQSNQLTGNLNTLVGLPLDSLNVAHNNFSGWIPHELSSIHNFIFDGNSFDNGPAPPPPPFTSPPPSRSHNSHRRSGSGSHNKTRVSDNESSDSNNGLTTGAIIGIIIGSILVAVILILALFFCVRKQKGKEKVTKTSSGSLPHGTTNEEGSWFHIRKTSLILYSTNLKITSRLHILCVMLVSFVVWSQFVCLYGGTSKGPQISSLKSGIDIVIGTPGCIQDLIEMGVCSLKDVSFVVLDEADRMLDMSFEQVVRSMLDRMH